MPAKSTNESFIKSAHISHGDKYNYSKVIYTNNRTKVIIICDQHGEFLQSPMDHLVGKGCMECGGSPRKDTAQFIQEAIDAKGDLYDYSKAIYVNKKTNVIIICRTHGEFLQTPDSHLNQKSGCRECAGNTIGNNDKFIRSAITKHGEAYDYSQVEYIRSFLKVNIICNKHGVFSMTPNAHLRGNGCYKCAGYLSVDTKSFIEQAHAKYGDLYGYDKVLYINNATKIIITCKIHGDFLQTPNNHLHSKTSIGCQGCAGTISKTTDEFIIDAKKIHFDKYDYGLVEYKTWHHKIKILCKTHGIFLQEPASHLSGSGCMKCSFSCISKLETEWLDSLNIPVECRNKSIIINKRRFYPDGIDDVNKIIYEFYGDRVHGNPRIYNKNEYCKWLNRLNGELFYRTIEKEVFLKNAGYIVITMWEDDWLNFKKRK